MNKCLEFIAYGLHQIQRTFFPNLEHEAGPIPESLVELSYILQTIYQAGGVRLLFKAPTQEGFCNWL